MAKTNKAEFSVTPYQSTADRLFNPYFKLDPNEDVRVDIAAWQKKSLYLHKTSAIVAGATQNATRFILGSGIYPKISIKSGKGAEEDYRIKNELEKVYYKWASSAGLDNTSNLDSVLFQVISEIIIWGDVLVYVTTDDYSEIPFKLDLIPSISVVTPDSKDAIQGVCVRSKRTVGYYIKSDNKKGWEYIPRYINGDFSSILLKSPAKNYRIGQVRGEPLIAPALNTLKDIDALLKQNVKSAINRNKNLGVITSQSPNDVAKAQAAKNASHTIESSEDGTILTLKPGESYNQFSAKDTQDATLPQLLNELLKLVAGPYGLPHAILFNDLTDLSFSSSRTLLGMAWDSQAKYHDYISDSLLLPVFNLLVKWVAETGRISGFSPDMVSEVEFVYKPISQLKLKEQYEANQLAIATGAKSEIQIASENGEDALQVAREQIELEAFKKDLRKEKGLIDANSEV